MRIARRACLGIVIPVRRDLSNPNQVSPSPHSPAHEVSRSPLVDSHPIMDGSDILSQHQMHQAPERT